MPRLFLILKYLIVYYLNSQELVSYTLDFSLKHLKLLINRSQLKILQHIKTISVNELINLYLDNSGVYWYVEESQWLISFKKMYPQALTHNQECILHVLQWSGFKDMLLYLTLN